MAERNYSGGTDRTGGAEDARYRPYVLRRLTDMHPEEKTENYSTTISIRDVKEDIYDNINMIFNSSSHRSLEELKNSPELGSSVLAYGVTDYCGNVSSREDRERLREHIVKQITDFEPRLDPLSLEVSLSEGGENYTATMEFDISGRVTVGEVSEEMLFVSKLNVETGKAEMQLVKN